MQDNKVKPKIAFVVDTYSRGGVSVVLQDLLQYLVRENAYEITLFVRRYNNANMRAVPEGVTCLPWEEYQTIPDAIRCKDISAVFNILRNSLCSILNIRNHGKRIVYKARQRKMFPGEFACVIGYHMVPNDVTVVALEKIHADRKLLWLHFRKNITDKDVPFYSALYSNADSIVCVSKGTEVLFQNRFPDCAQKTTAIYNLYNIPFIQSQAAKSAEGMNTEPGPIKIVSTARLAREKGFDRVPAVARKLVDAGYDFQWYIIGEGDKRAEIEKDISEKNVADRIHLLGHKENPYPYVNNCDIYVQPSYMEGFCTSTMEAKILCKPVVTTDVPGMREQFVDGENGLIVESSVQGIYEGIRRLIDSPQLREQIIEKLQAEPVPNEAVLQQTMRAIDGPEK